MRVEIWKIKFVIILIVSFYPYSLIMVAKFLAKEDAAAAVSRILGHFNAESNVAFVINAKRFKRDLGKPARAVNKNSFIINNERFQKTILL